VKTGGARRKASTRKTIFDHVIALEKDSEKRPKKNTRCERFSPETKTLWQVREREEERRGTGKVKGSGDGGKVPLSSGLEG